MLNNHISGFTSQDEAQRPTINIRAEDEEVENDEDKLLENYEANFDSNFSAILLDDKESQNHQL